MLTKKMYCYNEGFSALEALLNYINDRYMLLMRIFLDKQTKGREDDDIPCGAV